MIGLVEHWDPVLIRLLCCLLLALSMLALPAGPAAAELHSHPGDDGTPVVSSLESLRDLDYQAWQLVAYREGPPGGLLRLTLHTHIFFYISSGLIGQEGQ